MRVRVRVRVRVCLLVYIAIARTCTYLPQVQWYATEETNLLFPRQVSNNKSFGQEQEQEQEQERWSAVASSSLLQVARDKHITVLKVVY